MARRDAHRRAERTFGARKIARPPAGRAQVVLRIEQGRIQLHRSLELDERLGHAGEAAQGEPELVVRGCARWTGAHGALVHAGGGCEIAAPLEDLAKREQRLERIRLLSHEPLQHLLGGFELAGRRQLPRFTDDRSHVTSGRRGCLTRDDDGASTRKDAGPEHRPDSIRPAFRVLVCAGQNGTNPRFACSISRTLYVNKLI